MVPIVSQRIAQEKNRYLSYPDLLHGERNMKRLWLFIDRFFVEVMSMVEL